MIARSETLPATHVHSRASEITLASPTDLSTRRLSLTPSARESPRDSPARHLLHTQSEKSPFKLKKLQSAVQDPEKGLWKCRHCPHEYPEPNPTSRVRRHHKKLCPGQSADEGEDSVSHDVSGQDFKTDDTNRGSTNPNTPEIQSKYKGLSQTRAVANFLDVKDANLAPKKLFEKIEDANLVDVKDDFIVSDNSSHERAGVNWMDVNDDLIVPHKVSQEKAEVNWIDAGDDLFGPQVPGTNIEAQDIGKDGEVPSYDREQTDEKPGNFQEKEPSSVQVTNDDSHDGGIPSEKEEARENYSRSSYGPGEGDDLSEIGATATEVDKQHPTKEREFSPLQVQENDSSSSYGAGEGDQDLDDETDKIGDALSEKFEGEEEDSDYEVDQKSDNNDEYQSMDSAVYVSSGVGHRHQFEHNDAQDGDDWEHEDAVLPQESGPERQPDKRVLGTPGVVDDTDARHLNVDDQTGNLYKPDKEVEGPGGEKEVMMPTTELPEKLALEEGSQRRERQHLLHSSAAIPQEPSSLARPVDASSPAKRIATERFVGAKSSSLKSSDDDEVEDVTSEDDSSEGQSLSIGHDDKHHIQKLLREQKAFDLICPICGSRITNRVILRKRRRKFISKVDLQLETPVDITQETLDDKENIPSPASNDTKKDAPGCFGYFPLFAR